MTIPRLMIAALVAALALPAWGARAASDHTDHAHSVIRIGSRLHPEQAQVSPDDALIWVNYSSRVARVVFAADVAKNLKCESASSFTLDGDRLVSRDIQASQFASLCRLAPGEYTYEIELFSGAGTGGFAEAARKFTGAIQVK
jgi:hypothetical protein